MTPMNEHGIRSSQHSFAPDVHLAARHQELVHHEADLENARQGCDFAKPRNREEALYFRDKIPPGQKAFIALTPDEARRMGYTLDMMQTGDHLAMTSKGDIVNVSTHDKLPALIRCDPSKAHRPNVIKATDMDEPPFEIL